MFPPTYCIFKPSRSYFNDIKNCMSMFYCHGHDAGISLTSLPGKIVHQISYIEIYEREGDD